MSLKINSFCVKDPEDPRSTKPHQLPIYATSSFAFSSIEEGMDIFRDPSSGHIYGRFANPTVDAVSQKIADLEAYGCNVDQPFGIMTSSGMSAVSTLILSLLNQGDKILTQGNLYGGTTELIKNVIKRYGIEAVFVNLRDDTEIEAALKQHPEIKMVYFETPSNPSLDCIDMAHMTAIAREYGLISVVDNTFSTPILQQPFKYGVDFIVHSTTKYLNGHGNSVAGIIIGSGKEDWEKVWKTMKLIGTNCNPFDAWLTNMGMKTLAVRMKQHCENGMLLAQFLEDHPKVRDVRYLGLPEHPDHSLAVRQMNGYSGMLCFELEGGLEEGKKFMNAQSIGALAPTLGDVDTLILHPASMSHLNVDKDIRMRNGISDGLIRVSVGLEDITDLTEDFDRALGQI